MKKPPTRPVCSMLCVSLSFPGKLFDASYVFLSHIFFNLQRWCSRCLAVYRQKIVYIRSYGHCADGKLDWKIMVVFNAGMKMFDWMLIIVCTCSCSVLSCCRFGVVSMQCLSGILIGRT